jgi:hypothetical protein
VPVRRRTMPIIPDERASDLNDLTQGKWWY